MQIKTRVAGVVAVSASAVALMAAPAFAQPVPSGNGNVTGVGNLSVLNGNTANVPITAPINLCGGAIAILGFANAHCVGGAEATVVNDSTIENYGFGF
jgi:ChpA-C